jgi:hypothetical protein
MPLQKLQFRPGLNREGTIYSNEGGWYDGNNVRFRSGLPEKIGGWTQVSSSQYNGVCRSLWTWLDADSNVGTSYIGLGTNTQYYIFQGGTYFDITPIIETDTLNDPFTTVSGSKVVTVTASTLTSVFWGSGTWGSGTWGGTGTTSFYTPNAGDYVIFSNATTVGGLNLNGIYKVQTVIANNEYTILAQTTASSSATGGGSVTAAYEFPTGLAIASVGNGWGTGSWGRGTWSSSYASSIGTQLRLWTNDNFGADLVLAPRGGPIFYWQDSNGVNTPAQYLSNLANQTTLLVDGTTFSSGSNSITITSANAPYVYPYSYVSGVGLPTGTYVTEINNVTGVATINQTTTANSSGSYTFSYSGSYVPTKTYQVIASEVQEFLIAFGANSYIPGEPNSDFNPMLVRWSDQANAYQWVPEVTNQSGEYTLTNGSFIMGARSTRQEILVWTDSAIYSMQYIGAPYVWGFQMLMDNTSIMSPNCMITINNITYWMGKDRFYMYNGTVQTLPCSLKQYIYDDINQDQAYQIFAGANEGFNEVWWFYVSKSSNNTYIDRYVIYNYLDNVWYYGSSYLTSTTAGSFITGKQYVITYIGNTDFTQCGASSNTVGTVFTATNAGGGLGWGVGTWGSSVWGGAGTGTAMSIDGLARTAWLQSGGQYPIAADYNNRLLYQENGNDDNSTTSTLPIYAYIQSSDFDINDGQQFGFIWRILPDINFNGSTTNQPYVTMQALPRQNSGSAYGTADNPQVQSTQNFTNVPEYTVNQFTGQVYTRLRGRQMAFRVESNSVGVAWQLGSPRIDVRPDGRR